MKSPRVVQKSVQFLYQKRGFYYYQRRVPIDLWVEYRKNKVVIALKTSCRNIAKRASQSITAQLDLLWADLRLKHRDVPANNLLLSYQKTEPVIPKLSEAAELYLTIKGAGKGKTFKQGCDRSKNCLIKFAGDIPIDRYTRADANGLRDSLLAKGLAPQSVKRRLSVIKTIINLNMNEHGIDGVNVFAKIEYGVLTPVKKRAPIPIENIRSVQSMCKNIDDEMRWLINILSDSGMRLSEACGLLVSDLKVDDDIPIVDIKPHKWRSLKTDGSIRQVPLVGASLWAARRIHEMSESIYAIPRYTNGQTCNANSASAALNKWLAPHVPKGCVLHSFRHSLRDRLRAVQCPSDIIDQIGGWSTSGGVGHTYGDGYPMNVLYEWLLRLEDD